MEKEKRISYIVTEWMVPVLTSASGAFCAVLLILQGQWGPLLLFLAALAGAGFLFRHSRREYARELETLSDLAEQILEKKTLHMGTEDVRKRSAETMEGKIINQLVRLDEMNRGVQTALEQERDGIREMIAEVAHQVKNPLANMEAWLELLRDQEDSAEPRQCLDAVADSEKKIRFLIEKFITAARLENRVIQIRKADTDMKETVARAVFQVYKKAEEKHIFIEICQEGKRPVLVPHDRNWICEGIYNLLDNSIKYSPRDSRITVLLRKNEMFTEIRVDDEGCGIREGEENRIFQMFCRGENVNGEEGYGMGLFITREIVKKHDGFMKVRRRERGLSMSVYLPEGTKGMSEK